MRAHHLLAAGCGALLLLAGCGTSHIDTANIERQLRERIATEAAVPVRDVRVECPRDVDEGVGRTFTCTVKHDDTQRRVRIRLEAGNTYSATVQTRTGATP